VSIVGSLAASCCGVHVEAAADGPCGGHCRVESIG
jgi:hypothetical protein